MNQFLFEIDASNLNTEVEDDIIQIKFPNEDFVQICYSKLVSYSKYFRDKYKYSEAINCIQGEIEQFKSEYEISDDCIKYFFELIQQDKVSIPIEYCKNFYTLSEYFKTPKIRRLLDQTIEKELLKNLNFAVQILIDSHAIANNEETKFKCKIENILSTQINECFKIQKFGELPISTVFRIIQKSDIEKVDINSLVDFIIESARSRHILLTFVELHKISDDKINKLLGFIESQKAEVKKVFTSFMPSNFSFIKQMRELLKQAKQEVEEAKKEVSLLNNEIEKLKKEKTSDSEKMNSLNDEIKKLEKEKTSDSEKMNSLNDEIKKLEKEKTSDSEKMKSLNDEIEKLKNEKTSNNEKMNSLNENISRICNQIVRLKKENEEKIKNLIIGLEFKESVQMLKLDEIKKCPGCGRPIIKTSQWTKISCNCGKHWCYKCGACFCNKGECYSHLKSEHGGYID